VIKGYGFLIPWIDYPRRWDDNNTYDEIIMKMTFCFPIEMSDYNQNSKNFMFSVYNEKYLGEAPCHGV
jgi:hypothetical protein